jgi:Fumarylacetoacetate (FAA) hydrolase family
MFPVKPYRQARVPELIAYISAGITLEPGDIIATGTPSGVALGMNPPKYLVPGDTVSIEITAIGELVNTVAAGLVTGWGVSRGSCRAAQETHQPRSSGLLQADGQVRLDEGEDVRGPDHGSVALKADDVAVGHVESLAPARVAAVPDLEVMVARLERHLGRLVDFDGADGLAVD